MIFIGIDNGVSGSVGIINEHSVAIFPMPVRKVLNYTKSKQFLNRVNGKDLMEMLRWLTTSLVLGGPGPQKETFCMIERPMVNPKRWKASMSAMRALEATETVLELMKIPYEFIDSKEWQKQLLPKGLEGEELKLASLRVGKRLFPTVDLNRHTDADGLLIAEFAKRIWNIRNGPNG